MNSGERDRLEPASLSKKLWARSSQIDGRGRSARTQIQVAELASLMTVRCSGGGGLGNGPLYVLTLRTNNQLLGLGKARLGADWQTPKSPVTWGIPEGPSPRTIRQLVADAETCFTAGRGRRLFLFSMFVFCHFCWRRMAQLAIWVSIGGVCVRTSLLRSGGPQGKVNGPGIAFESCEKAVIPGAASTAGGP